MSANKNTYLVTPIRFLPDLGEEEIACLTAMQDVASRPAPVALSRERKLRLWNNASIWVDRQIAALEGTGGLAMAAYGAGREADDESSRG
jgi:hypothetical protein